MALKLDPREHFGLSLSDAFLDALQSDLDAHEQRRTSFLQWAMKVPETKGPLNFERWPFQRELYEEGFDDKELVVMKGTQLGLCLDPGTRVLTADMRWVRIADVPEGMELVAIDENVGDGGLASDGKGQTRKLRRTRVLKKWAVEKEAYELELEDGRTLIASGDHRFLVRVGGTTQWRAVKDLEVGRKLRHVAYPWDGPSVEDGWMGGLLDGEGSLRRRESPSQPYRYGCECVVAQQQGPVLDRAIAYFEDRGYVFNQSFHPRPSGTPVGHLTVYRLEQIMRLLGTTQPTRWQNGWWEGAKLGGKGGSWVPIVAIRPVGERSLIDLHTEHSTFIAEGVVSHNSAWLVRWALCWADMHAARVLYIFPRERQLLDFSDGRIKPLILGEYLRTRVPPASVMNKTLKSVGLGICYFRGSEAEAGLESIDADALCLDEHDLLVQAHIPIAERRVGGQDSLGMIRRVGFPTISDHGIHKEYKRTDQREWHVKCERCGEWQTVTWAENIDLERAIRVCRKCRRGPLDMTAGQWVATYPSRALRGYHVTKLLLPDESIVASLIEASREQVAYKRQIFFNRDLGEPWEAEGARLTAAMIAAAQRAYTQPAAYQGSKPVVMGVDVASTRALNVWISEQVSDTQGRALYLGLVDSFDELARLMDRYRVVMAAIDHLPEGRLARAFANRFAGRVYIVSYSGEQQKDVLALDDTHRRASVRRTEAIDAAQERIRSQREYLPQDLPSEFVVQMCANVRSVEQDDVGRVKVLYRADGPDDWMQALTYALVANECWWIRQQINHEEITSIDEMTDLGFQRSTLREDSMHYSPGRNDGSYMLEPGDDGFGEDSYSYE